VDYGFSLPDAKAVKCKQPPVLKQEVVCVYIWSKTERGEGFEDG
jgi:hypothetical protein